MKHPFPWKTILAYPFLWLIGWFSELIHSSIVHDLDEPLTPLSVLEPERPKATIRLWDKDFKLLAEWETDAHLYVSYDHDGQREGGPLHSIRWECP
jgi:hypothetical protein